MIARTLLHPKSNKSTFVRSCFICEALFIFHFSLGCQLTLAKKYHLPLFLHSRSAHEDLVRILREEGFDHDGGAAVGGAGGVVHSFTGTAQDCIDYVSPLFVHSVTVSS
jgi:Tat protein secretion system quality control protein TatD with DNase activity